MMLKQLSPDNLRIFEIGLARGAGWEDLAIQLMAPKSEWPAIRELYFKTVRNRKKAA